MRQDDPTTTAAQQPRDGIDDALAGIAILAEPVRRTLYRYVVAQGGPVNRDQAAEGARVARHVAKFHLDKLVDEGLLDASYARPPGRGGPGAGRPTKLYRRSSRELDVSLPARRYELAGRLLAEAVTVANGEGVAVGDALGRVARDAGRSLGRQAREQAGPRAGRRALLAATSGILAECGYQPRGGPAGITLANCPFHALAHDYPDLVCGMNVELLSGLVQGVGLAGVAARLDPAPDRCCVVVGPAPGRAVRR